FLQDNARPHVTKTTHDKIVEPGWEIMPHSPYSPNFPPINLHLFLSLDNHTRNKQFNNERDLKKVSRFFLAKTKDFCKNGIDKLLNRCEKVIECKGSYFDE
ncbi:Histone-lysine N-methyltransferase SETMAR, partial [Habropoda laboriosa]